VKAERSGGLAAGMEVHVVGESVSTHQAASERGHAWCGERVCVLCVGGGGQSASARA
jgi:hypothetical protein